MLYMSCTCDVHVVYMWCTCGEHMVYMCGDGRLTIDTAMAKLQTDLGGGAKYLFIINIFVSIDLFVNFVQGLTVLRPGLS